MDTRPTATYVEVKRILNLAWPVMGAQLLWLSMVFVDNIMVGRLGQDPLASMAMASTLFSFLYVSSMGVLSALSPIISHAFGAGQQDTIATTVRQGIRLSVLLSLVIILVFFQSHAILGFLGQKEHLLGDARSYLIALAWGVPAQVGFICLRQFSEAISDTKASFIIVAIGASLNVPLDYALIFGKWGLPELGVVGAGYATSTLSWVMLISMVVYMGLSRKYQAYGIWKGPFRTDWGTIREIIRIGVPTSGGMVAEMAFFGGTTLMMGTIGSQALASHQIALNAAAFMFMLPLGLSIGVAIRLGQLRGANDVLGVRVASRASLLITLGTQCIPASLFLLYPEPIARLYTSDPELLGLACYLLQIGGIFQIFDGLQVVGIAALRGLKDTRIPFINTLISFWLVGAPFGMWLTFSKGVGPSGLWFGMMGGLALASALHWGRLYYLIRLPQPAMQTVRSR